MKHLNTQSESINRNNSMPNEQNLNSNVKDNGNKKQDTILNPFVKNLQLINLTILQFIS